ncbi:hypothetical protein [uncultured Gammaproteobacteria bacterium]|nr:hypothetical protein [uncultured Gammaproteobacteria bacterium]CAC9953456.1 hypothetical protein [uncultured Gammaproteobacteria bacterium]
MLLLNRLALNVIAYGIKVFGHSCNRLWNNKYEGGQQGTEPLSFDRN